MWKSQLSSSNLIRTNSQAEAMIGQSQIAQRFQDIFEVEAYSHFDLTNWKVPEILRIVIHMPEISSVADNGHSH